MRTCYLCGRRSSGRAHKKCQEARDRIVMEQWMREQAEKPKPTK